MIITFLTDTSIALRKIQPQTELLVNLYYKVDEVSELLCIFLMI